jgi:hypothetical protein
MRYKVGELEGALLDAAVQLVEAARPSVAKPFLLLLHAGSDEAIDVPLPAGAESVEPAPPFWYSRSWTHGGPIIERELIMVEPNDDFADIARADATSRGTAWHAGLVHEARADGVQRTWATGPTPLIAAMRAYVASKFGEEVELP